VTVDEFQHKVYETRHDSDERKNMDTSKRISSLDGFDGIEYLEQVVLARQGAHLSAVLSTTLIMLGSLRFSILITPEGFQSRLAGYSSLQAGGSDSFARPRQARQAPSL